MKTNPYPGLRPFRQDEAHLFFGRDGQTDTILERLKTHHFVAMVGVSGCGKSSLLNAGVFPGLHGGLLATGQREWRLARFQPRDRPLRALSAALVAAGAVVDQGPETAELAEGMLQHSSVGLVNLVRGRLIHDTPAEEPMGNAFALLVVVDQFEELFRFSKSGSAEEAAHFVQILVEAVRQGQNGLPLYVALAMRSDFLGDCAVFPDLPELINQSQYLVPRMALNEREAAIARPAETEGRQIARPLLDRLLDDMGDNPDQLPVLQHALQQTWEAWRERTKGEGPVELEDYLEVGGMDGAIKKHAETTLASLDSRGALAAPLFRCITELTEDRRPIRRPLPLGKISRITALPVDELKPVIEAFRSRQNTFLTPPHGIPLDEETVIDISHESLIRNWPRLRDWASDEAAAARELRRLERSAGDFFEENQDPLNALELARVENWQHGIVVRAKLQDSAPEEAIEEAPLVPSPAWASLYLGDGENQNPPNELPKPDAFSRIGAYIEKSKALLAARHRRERLLRTAIKLLAATIVIGGGYFLWREYHDKAVKAALTQKAETEASKSLQLVKVLSETANQLSAPLVANVKAALADAEQRHAALVNAISVNPADAAPDQSLIEDVARTRTAANRAIANLQDLEASLEKAMPTAHDAQISYKTADLAIELLDARRRQQLLQSDSAARDLLARAMTARVTSVEQAFDGLDKKDMVSAAFVAQKDKEIGGATAQLDALASLRRAAVAFDFADPTLEDSERLASLSKIVTAARQSAGKTSAGVGIMTWTPANAVARFYHGARISRVRFAPGGILVSGGEDAMVEVWNARGANLGWIVTDHVINDLALNADGSAVVVAGTGSTVPLFHWTHPLSPKYIQPEKLRFERHSDSVTDVEFSHRGGRVVSTSADRTVRVFDSKTVAQLYFTSPPLPEIVTAAVFHPGDNLVASACDDGGVRLHTIDQPSVRLLGKFGAPARRPGFSPDGKYVLASSGDKTARIWPILGEGETEADHPAPVTQGLFRPVQAEGSYTFVTTATNGEVRLFWFNGKTAFGKILELRHAGAALFATWRDDGNWLATVGGGEVILWQWQDNWLQPRLRIGQLAPGTSRAEFSPAGDYLVTYGGDNGVYLWNLKEVAPR